MPTFQGSLVEASGSNYIGRQQPRYSLEYVEYVATFTIPTGFATNDVVEMLKVGAGFKVTKVELASNAAVGAATTQLAVGDGASTGRFISATTYQSAVITRLNVPAGLGYIYTAADTIDVLGSTITTPTVGTIITLVVGGTFT